MRAILSACVLIFLPVGTILAQTAESEAVASSADAPVKIALDVPAGTPLRIVLANEFRIRKAGQPIQGKIAEPVYAYDKLVVPVGSEVGGSISRISAVPAPERAKAALDANFTPTRELEITFDKLRLPDGRIIPIDTQVSPASQGVLKFAIAADVKNHEEKTKKNATGELASTKVSEKKREISNDWEAAKKLISTPGRLHRVKRMAVAELPFHPQYLDAGTRFNAELLGPLNFGSEELTQENIRMVGTAPADGTIVHAILKTPLDSAKSQKGELVEAEMTEPLLSDGHLILPEGTVLRGSVLQVQAARHLHRNGQLRIVFHEIAPPRSVEQHVEASLEGVEVKSDENLSLDAEGGAQATSPKTRYFSSAVSVAVAGLSYDDDPLNRILNGASGYSLIGVGLGAIPRSQPLAMGFGALGASRSIYRNFISHGQDVVYPKDTAMAIGFGARVTTAPKSSKFDPDTTKDNGLLATN